jgi:hypothetical protein
VDPVSRPLGGTVTWKPNSELFLEIVIGHTEEDGVVLTLFEHGKQERSVVWVRSSGESPVPEHEY